MVKNEELTQEEENKNSLTEEEREKLIGILTMSIPIDKITKRTKNKKECIKVSKPVINSTQLYINDKDSDMCDFSLGFYEILYNEILKEMKILDGNGYFTNNNFAGDTMNSFNTIANLTGDVGISQAERPLYSEWPEEIQNLYVKYHCLANFWLIPMEIGRCSTSKHSKTSGGRQDYMDRYLGYVEKNWKDLNNDTNVGEYFSMFDSFDDFCEKHYIPEFVPNSNEKEPYITINQMINFIDKRAELIADGDKAKALFDYFKELGLID